jgi:hypothetical protein
MVPDPDEFDCEDYLETLPPEDKSDLTDLFEEKYRNIDVERVKKDLENKINQQEREIIESAQSIVGGFHPRRRGRDSSSGFEFEFFSPLCEIGVDGGDLLMARADYNSLHLCIVVCEIGGENPREWVTRINNIDDILDSDNLDRLKEQLDCSSHSVETLQYITLAREVDLQGFNYSNFNHLVDVDTHSIWERNREEREFRHLAGTLGHQDLADAIDSGFEYESVGAPTIQYLIGSHPILALEEAVFTLVYDNVSRGDEYPQEFEQSEFRDRYESSLQLGADGNEYDELVTEEVNKIISFGKKIDLIEDDSDEIDSNRDYDLKFSGEKPHMAKQAVMNKYLKHQAPIEHGNRAFSRAKSEFDPSGTDLDQF